MPDGTFRADGGKYYIGNGNEAALLSVFGKDSETDEYVFFAVRTDHRPGRDLHPVILAVVGAKAKVM